MTGNKKKVCLKTLLTFVKSQYNETRIPSCSS